MPYRPVDVEPHDGEIEIKDVVSVGQHMREKTSLVKEAANPPKSADKHGSRVKPGMTV